MAFKMKGHELPGPNQRSGNSDGVGQGFRDLGTTLTGGTPSKERQKQDSQRQAFLANWEKMTPEERAKVPNVVKKTYGVTHMQKKVDPPKFKKEVETRFKNVDDKNSKKIIKSDKMDSYFGVKRDETKGKHPDARFGAKGSKSSTHPDAKFFPRGERNDSDVKGKHYMGGRKTGK